MIPTETTALWSREMFTISWQFAVLALMTWLVLRFSRKRLSARARHFIWLVVLMRLLLPIGLSSPWGLVESAPELSLPGGGGMSSMVPASTIAQAPSVAETVRASAALGPLEWALVVWVIGVAILLGAWASRSIVFAVRLRRHWSAASESIQEAVRHHCRQLGFRRSVPVMVVEDEMIRGPGVIGVRIPRIVVPRRLFDSLPDEQRAAVLVHELVHISRRDHLSQALTGLLQCLYFFHPAVWLVARALRAERERAVDDRVVASLGERVGRYADALLHFALDGGRRLTAPVVGMAAPRSQVAIRLRRMLAEDYSATRRSRRTVLVVALLAVVATVTLAASAMGDPRPEGDRPRVRAMCVYPAVQVIRDGRPTWVDVTGDFEVGRFEKESFDLRGRLDSLAREKVELLAEQRAILEVEVDAAGRPESVKVLQAVDPELDEVLVESLRNMRFEPTRHRVEGPVPVRVNVHFFSEKERPPVDPVEASVRPEEMEKRFAEIYALKPGRVLKLMPAPHPEERMALYRMRRPSQAEAIPDGPDKMIVELRDGVAQIRGVCFGCDSLAFALSSIAVSDARVLDEASLLRTPVEMDVLIEKDSTQEQRLADLDRELRQRFGISVRIVRHETEAIVMRGRFGEISGAPGSNGGPAVWLSLEEHEDDGAGGGMITSARKFADLLELQVGVPVEVEGVSDPEQEFELHFHSSSRRTERIPELLQVIEAQSGLNLTLERRTIDALLVEEAEAGS